VRAGGEGVLGHDGIPRRRGEPLSVVIFVSNDVVDTTGRVFRRPKDVADAILERRLHGQRQDE